MQHARRTAPVWIAIATVLIVIVGVLVWHGSQSAGQADPVDPTPTAEDGISGADPQSPNAPSPTPPTSTPSPQPTEVTPPEPGATETITKPAEELTGNLADEVQMESGVEVEIVSLEAVTAGREIPGETSGPAVEVTLRATNVGDEPLDTGGTSVNLEYGGEDRTPAPSVSDPDESGFPPTIDPGKSADGNYLFAVPIAIDGDIRIIVDVLASEPNVVFSGARP